MKVLLINPPYHAWYTRFGFRLPPLGLAYLAAKLLQDGVSVHICDLAVERSCPDFQQYQLVGIGSDTSRINTTLQIAAQAHQAGCKVVLGGPHPSVLDSTLLQNPAVDFVIRGEGEQTLSALVSSLAQGTPLEEIRGLSFRHQGQVIRNPDRPFVQDLDSLPWPARHLLPMERYKSARIGLRSITPVITSRGCPFRCSFCASSFLNGPRWRARSAQAVVDEMEYVTRTYGYEAVAFSDDNSSLDPQRLQAICREIIARKLDLITWLFLRVDTAARHPELISWMARAGLRSVFMGIESFNQSDLDRIHKKTRIAQIYKAVALLKQHQIEILASYIIGYPTDNSRAVRERIRLACALDTNTVQFTALTPYPGTPIYNQLKPQITSEPWHHYDGYHPILKLARLSKWQVGLALLYAHLRFYLRSANAVRGFLRFVALRQKWLRRWFREPDDWRSTKKGS